MAENNSGKPAGSSNTENDDDDDSGNWGKAETAAVVEGVGTSIELLGDTAADNQSAEAHRVQAELDRARAEEITRRADISMQQVSTASRAIVSSQKTALVSRGVSASGNQAAMVAADSINEAIKEQVNIDTAAKYDRDMALASAKSHEDQADNLDSSMLGTITSIGVGAAVTFYTGGNVAAGAAAAKGTKAILG